ncbi:glucose/arabinose dehydrogenase [Isoptericola jiangsuensis]|uniref:Glucose/arabinose dehydrogenase n=1 Tax=Isoptericola jiangsuensis TaxID=548579 RepID=A0A2A9EV53_9MICO|nr:PQQ-dependent sugar dehydrogenase [Isoptericola jiangsuensis]PFG42115.1 glucose/arabinose dehydrogenase [Isoptericola jiangsuensis]
MTRHVVTVPAAALVAALLAACTPGAPDAASPAASSADASTPAGTATDPEDTGTAGAALAGEPEAFASDLEAPWSLVFRDGVPLVSERDSARILELADDGTAREVGVVAGVTPTGEAGLLGLAVDDDGRLYVSSTAAEGNRVQRYDVTGEPGALALGDPVTLLDGLPAAANHDGGRLAVGPDGMLYVTLGDAGNPADAQDPEVLAGKILRLTLDGEVPDDNPFPGSPVYSLGHRNPQGIAWADDGTMFATEFGQNTWDELNVIEAGANYGWPEVEGAAGRDGFTDPVQQWAPSEASPSGMAQAGGTLFVANLRGEVLRTVPVADPSTSQEHWAGEHGRLRDAVVGPDGRLWVLTNETDGRGSPAPGDDHALVVDLTTP